MNNVKTLLKEAYNEMMKEFEDDMNPTRSDIETGDIAAQLAQAKGELATIMDRAGREGIISRGNGKIRIIKKDEWLKRAGNLPQRIKQLQHQLTPDPNINADEPN